MLVFPGRVNRPSNVTVDHLYDTDGREHCRPVMFGDEQSRLHRGLPFVGVRALPWAVL